MSTKLTKQERLYDETQLAKAIFIEQAKKLDFTYYELDVVDKMIKASFLVASLFLDQQEVHADDT